VRAAGRGLATLTLAAIVASGAVTGVVYIELPPFTASTLLALTVAAALHDVAIAALRTTGNDRRSRWAAESAGIAAIAVTAGLLRSVPTPDASANGGLDADLLRIASTLGERHLPWEMTVVAPRESIAAFVGTTFFVEDEFAKDLLRTPAVEGDDAPLARGPAYVLADETVELRPGDARGTKRESSARAFVDEALRAGASTCTPPITRVGRWSIACLEPKRQPAPRPNGLRLR
jgi:hypothetical protein